jgi:hypothetical protein
MAMKCVLLLQIYICSKGSKCCSTIYRNKVIMTNILYMHIRLMLNVIQTHNHSPHSHCHLLVLRCIICSMLSLLFSLSSYVTQSTLSNYMSDAQLFPRLQCLSYEEPGCDSLTSILFTRCCTACFSARFFILIPTHALMLPVAVSPSQCVTLYYMLDAQLFLQPRVFLSCQNRFFTKSAYLTENTTDNDDCHCNQSVTAHSSHTT